MDKRQLRQSAVADFMESLEHLDELLGETTDNRLLEEDNLQPTDAEKSQTSSRVKPTTVNSLTKQSSHQPGAKQA
ncbi:MAG: hypothetical protein AAF579_18815 [Cyanobacteria bacterium P01_C01_bin.118]